MLFVQVETYQQFIDDALGSERPRMANSSTRSSCVMVAALPSSLASTVLKCSIRAGPIRTRVALMPCSSFQACSAASQTAISRL